MVVDGDWHGRWEDYFLAGAMGVATAIFWPLFLVALIGIGISRLVIGNPDKKR
jgi:hypothetical protein